MTPELMGCLQATLPARAGMEIAKMLTAHGVPESIIAAEPDQMSEYRLASDGPPQRGWHYERVHLPRQRMARWRSRQPARSRYGWQPHRAARSTQHTSVPTGPYSPGYSRSSDSRAAIDPADTTIRADQRSRDGDPRPSAKDARRPPLHVSEVPTGHDLLLNDLSCGRWTTRLVSHRNQFRDLDA
jgi:hypothetical protein